MERYSVIQNTRKEISMIILFTNKNNDTITPTNLENYYDLGYKGLENDLPNIKIVLPLIKKKRIGEFTRQVKGCDKTCSRQKVIVEHLICKEI